jgi:site-specific recombinase XerD
MELERALTELLLARDYTPLSARRREEVLGEFIRWATSQDIRDLDQITRGVSRRYIAHLRERPNQRYGGKLASETQHSRASIVRMYLRFCAREGWIDDEVVAHFDMPRHSHKIVPVFTQAHFTRLVRAADAPRDRAILCLLMDTGIRAGELCSLTFDAVSISPQESYARIEGKGRRQREVGIGKQAALALHRYLSHRPKTALTNVFLSHRRGPLTPNALDRLLHRLRDEAGAEFFTGIRCSPHTLRHSFAVHYMEQGGDVYKLSRVLGHENIATTQRYLSAFQARDARRGASVLDSWAR